MLKIIKKLAKWAITCSFLATAYKFATSEMQRIARREANSVFNSRIEVERVTTDTRTATFVATLNQSDEDTDGTA